MRRPYGFTLLELMVAVAVASAAIAAGMGMIAAARVDSRSAAVVALVGRLADVGREHFGGRANGYADISLATAVAALADPGLEVQSPGTSPHVLADGVKVALAAGAERRGTATVPTTATAGATMLFTLTNIQPSVCAEVAQRYLGEAQVIRATGSGGVKFVPTGPGAHAAGALATLNSGCVGASITLEIQLL